MYQLVAVWQHFHSYHKRSSHCQRRYNLYLSGLPSEVDTAQSRRAVGNIDPAVHGGRLLRLARFGSMVTRHKLFRFKLQSAARLALAFPMKSSEPDRKTSDGRCIFCTGNIDYQRYQDARMPVNKAENVNALSVRSSRLPIEQHQVQDSRLDFPDSSFV